MESQINQTQHLASPASQIVGQHRAWLVRLITARVGSTALVDDVLQEVDLAVVQTSTPPKQASKCKSWLCTVALRQCALVLRKIQRQQRLLKSASANCEDGDPRLDDPIFWLLDAERANLVRDALARMEESKTDLLIRKYVDGMTYGQLAEELSVPAHVVEYRVVSARNCLRKLLIERGLGEEDLS